MRMLLADDNVEIRAALRLLLEEFGMDDIVEATDERQVLSAAEQSAVDVILLDWELSEGVSRSYRDAETRARSKALVEKVKRTHPHCRIIAMSCRPEAEESSRLAGCDGFVSRNDPPDHLLALLHLSRPGGRPEAGAGAPANG